jgi:hypothetical protein
MWEIDSPFGLNRIYSTECPLISDLVSVDFTWFHIYDLIHSNKIQNKNTTQRGTGFGK